MENYNDKNCGSSCCDRRHSSFWGWLLVILGAWFVAKELEWITSDFSIWPFVLVFVGIYCLVARNRNSKE